MYIVDFQYDVSSSGSTPDPLTVFLIQLLELLIGPGLLDIYGALDISKVLDRVWHVGLHKFNYEISGFVFGLI